MANTVRHHYILYSILAESIIGLVHWKIILHGFIDGYARFVLGIRASNNNRASTVLDLFEDITQEFGYPSRVRGDHGTENLFVAARMEEVRGLDRGSYIWGRLVFANIFYSPSDS